MKYYTKVLWFVLGIFFFESCHGCNPDNKAITKETAELIASVTDPKLKEHMYHLAHGKKGTIEVAEQAMTKAYEEGKDGDEEKTIRIMKFLLPYLRKEVDSKYDYKFIVVKAMMHKREKLIFFLLEQPDIDVNSRAKYEEYALIHQAMLYSSPAVVKALISKGASINTPTNPYYQSANAMTNKANMPLHILLSEFFFQPQNSPEERTQILDILLAQPDIDINAKNAEGKTPLRCVIEHQAYNSRLPSKDFDPKAIEKFLDDAEAKLITKGARV